MRTPELGKIETYAEKLLKEAFAKDSELASQVSRISVSFTWCARGRNKNYEDLLGFVFKRRMKARYQKGGERVFKGWRIQTKEEAATLSSGEKSINKDITLTLTSTNKISVAEAARLFIADAEAIIPGWQIGGLEFSAFGNISFPDLQVSDPNLW